MTRVVRFGGLAVVAIASMLTACNHASDVTKPAPTPPPAAAHRFNGVMTAEGAENGTIALQGDTTSPQGTLHFSDGTSLNITAGGYDPTTQNVIFDVAGYQFAAPLINGEAHGRYAGPGPGGNRIGAAALFETSNQAATLYCGTFAATGYDPGIWDIAIQGGRVTGVVSTAISPGSMISFSSGGFLSGSQSSGSLTLGMHLDTSDGTASGAVSGGTASGTWDFPSIGLSGAWEASTSACPM